MAGLRVVVVATGPTGDVDLDDLRAKIDEHRGALAALMITYPSTHGVYEADVREVCDAVHAAGGQVYVDGANLNALVGVARPGAFGGDVSHLNLHKTFCIPHGGGGPGRRARSRWPSTWRRSCPGAGWSARCRRRPYGSPGVLPIPWAYLRLMGLRRAAPGHAHRGRRGQLRRRAAGASTTRCSTPGRRAGWPTSASSTCGGSPRRPA